MLTVFYIGDNISRYIMACKIFSIRLHDINDTFQLYLLVAPNTTKGEQRCIFLVMLYPKSTKQCLIVETLACPNSVLCMHLLNKHVVFYREMLQGC